MDRGSRIIMQKEHKTARKAAQPGRISVGRKLGVLLDQAIGGRSMHLDDNELADAQELID